MVYALGRNHSSSACLSWVDLALPSPDSGFGIGGKILNIFAWQMQAL